MNKYIEIPTICPSCSYALTTINMQLFCVNTACTARLDKQIEHFCKVLGIKGMGAKTIQKLGLVDITEIYVLTESDLSNLLNSKTIGAKLFIEIERSKDSDLDTVLASFGIPLIGQSASSKLVKVVDSIDDITEVTCKQAGLGEKATNNILSFLHNDFPEMREFLPFSFKVQRKPAHTTNVVNVCMTGSLESFHTKAEAAKALVSAGFTVVDSVTKSTNYLVDETEAKQSSKRLKADSLGIKIIPDLLQFLNEKQEKKYE